MRGRRWGGREVGGAIGAERAQSLLLLVLLLLLRRYCSHALVAQRPSPQAGTSAVCCPPESASASLSCLDFFGAAFLAGEPCMNAQRSASERVRILHYVMSHSFTAQIGKIDPTRSRKMAQIGEASTRARATDLRSLFPLTTLPLAIKQPRFSLGAVTPA